MRAERHAEESIKHINFGFVIYPFLNAVFRYLPIFFVEMRCWATHNVPS